MKIAFFDLSSGVAGDMILAALLDAGLDFEKLKNGLKTLAFDGYELKVEKVIRSSISATHFKVILTNQNNNLNPINLHDHSHEHGDHSHHHDHPHKHPHTHSHKHFHASLGVNPKESLPNPDHHHRNLAEITNIINSSGIPEKVKKDAIKVFNLLGAAEAKVHGVTIDKIHFHEVGAVDSIVDIVGGCLGLYLLGIEKVFFSSFYFGSGHIKCAHGMMPLPAPATLNLTLGFNTIQTKVKGELTTPTGAAMMTALGNQVKGMSDWKAEVVGYGAGTRIQTEVLGAVRVVIGEQIEISEAVKSREVLQIEFNVDDMTPEQIGFLQDKLREVSKQDVWLESIYMKKNRLASKVCLLGEIQDIELIQKVIFSESSSFGFRFSKVSKVEFERDFETVYLNNTAIRIKNSYLNGSKKSSPEYEDCRQYAEKAGISIQQVFLEACNQLKK